MSRIQAPQEMTEEGSEGHIEPENVELQPLYVEIKIQRKHSDGKEEHGEQGEGPRNTALPFRGKPPFLDGGDDHDPCRQPGEKEIDGYLPVPDAQNRVDALIGSCCHEFYAIHLATPSL